MARTNKQGIASNKAQKARQASRMKGAKRFDYPKRKLTLEEAKETGTVGVQTNPAGRSFNWFLRGRKVCWETRLRVDPDGWRYVKLPSGSGDFVQVPIGGWLRKKMFKTTAKK